MDRFPTERSTLSAWVDELCRVFQVDSIKMRASLSMHVLNSQLVIVCNQLPVISDVLALVIAKENPITYLTVQLEYGSCSQLSHQGFIPLVADQAQSLTAKAALHVKICFWQTDVVRHNPILLKDSLLKTKQFGTVQTGLTLG